MEANFTELYLKWLKENFKSTVMKTELGEFIQISTPFLDRHNDHLQIYVKKQEGEYFLTDAGYIISDLDMCGCDVMSSPKRKTVLSTILNGFGVQIDGEQICTKATDIDFPQKKHALIQAMLSVNDMFFLSRTQIVNVFFEDVQLFFDTNYIPYVANAQFHGASGLSHTFEFTLPATRKKPERFVRTLNDVSRDKIDSILFSWGDIKELRKPGAKLYVIMNNTEKPVRKELFNALTIYGGTPLLWSEKEKYIEELAS
jgi:hypothetical protein